jgi:hypothetical protein
MSAYISEEFKITNIKARDMQRIVIAGLNQKFLYWLMTKTCIVNETM